MRRTIDDWIKHRLTHLSWQKSLVLSMLFNGYWVLANWYAISPVGYGGFFALTLFTVFGVILLIAILTILATPFLLFSRRFRPHIQHMFLASLVYAMIGIGCVYTSQEIRRWGFHQQAQRGNRLVHAIKSYETTYGTPPTTLDALVPQFLSAYPSTGMPAYPRYEYLTGHDAVTWENNPWVLYIDCPSGGINFDRFLYFPKQNYPPTGYGGSLEVLNGWAYVHE